MRLIDLSQPVFDECPNCPAHPVVSAKVLTSHGGGGDDTWHVELLTLASHTGSHVDAPLHKVPGGFSLDGVPLERWRGEAVIVDFRGIAARGRITAGMLREKLPDARAAADRFVLLCTGWGEKRARTQEWLHDAAWLGADGAQWLVDHDARGVGIDHYSIGDGTTHTILLSKPVLVVEELHFPAEALALKGPVEFWALPIHLRGMGGAPCRPVLVVPDGR